MSFPDVALQENLLMFQLVNEVADQTGPASLVAGAYPCSVVAVED